MSIEPDALDLSGLAEDDGLTLDEIQENAQDLLWEAGEMDPPHDIAYSLHRLDGAAGDALEMLDRQTRAAERQADALEKIAATFDAAVAALVAEFLPGQIIK